MELRNLCRIFILLFARHDDAPTTEKILSQWLFNHPLVSVGIARDLLILEKRIFHSNIFKKKKHFDSIIEIFALPTANHQKWIYKNRKVFTS